MNKNQFLQRIRQNLSGMPNEEINNVINYYIEYFEDANIDNNVDVTKILGNPDKVAKEIIQDYKANEGATNNVVYPNSFVGGRNNNINTNNNGYQNFNNGYVKKNDNSMKIVLIVLAIIFSPVLIGLSLGGIGLVIGITLAIFGVLIGIFAATGAIAVSGIAVIVVAFFLIPESMASFVFYLGCGLILASIGIILFYLVAILIKKIFGLIFNRKKKGGKTLVC